MKMKFKIIYSILFVFSGVVMPACSDSDDEISGNDTPPAGALPSAEFEPNSLPDEPYAEDAIRIVAEEEYAPFYALELMPDGNYLLTYYRPYNVYAPSVHVAANADGNFSIYKSRKAKAVRAGGVTDENGTVMLPDGSEYGKFTKLGNKRYRLGGGIEVDLQDATGSDRTISYRNYDGTVSRVYVSVSQPVAGRATKSLCRTWDYNSFEMWAYWNGKYVAHGKQTVNDGEVDTYFKAIGGDILGISREDFLDEDGEQCRKVIFTSVGTYICFYLDGDVEVALWSWTDEAQGTLHYEDSMANEDYDDEWDGYVTVRFAGRQMRIYEDYTYWEDDVSTRVVAVNTLTAAD